MSTVVEIREFEPAHQAEAAALINRGLGERFGFIDAGRNPDLFDIASAYGGGHFLLAFVDGRLAGTGALVEESPEVGRLVRMHTDARYRRRGIARTLLRALEGRAMAAGYRTLVLETNADWHDAIAFYRFHGYRETGRGRGEIDFEKPLTTQPLRCPGAQGFSP